MDDFQKVWGFVQGLHKGHQAKVKTQYPKSLEAAIQSALIFDDTMDKCALHKSTKYNTLHSNANKQKFASTVVETPKKPKGSSGLLSLQEYEMAKKEKLYYKFLSREHEKNDCP